MPESYIKISFKTYVYFNRNSLSGGPGSVCREKRRSSFLYLDDDEMSGDSSVAQSHHSSFAAGGEERHSGQGGEDGAGSAGDGRDGNSAIQLLVTPYAQILACLRQVLDNFLSLTQPLSMNRMIFG